MIIKKSELKMVPGTDPILHKAPAEFNFDGELDASMLTNLMFARMQEVGGIGLSAPQVGLDIKMFVMGIKEVKVEVFNPTIDSFSADEFSTIEGSLSFPGVQVMVKRPAVIGVTYFDKNGNKKQEELAGLTARIFQHEYDHMLGITLDKRVSKLKWDLASKKLKNRKDKFVKEQVQKRLLSIHNEIQEQNGNP